MDGIGANDIAPISGLLDYGGIQGDGELLLRISKTGYVVWNFRCPQLQGLHRIPRQPVPRQLLELRSSNNCPVLGCKGACRFCGKPRAQTPDVSH